MEHEIKWNSGESLGACRGLMALELEDRELISHIEYVAPFTVNKIVHLQ